MKKYIYFVFFICVCILSFGNILIEKEIFASMDIKNQEINIVIKSYDNLSMEYQKLFFNIDLPITIESTNKLENDNQREDKQIISTFENNNITMYEISNQNPQEMRNIIYNAISFAKDNDKCYLVFNLNNETEENGYFALIDSMELFYNMGIHITFFN